MPSTAGEKFFRASCRYVFEVSIADFGEGIVSVHRVDRLREFRTTRFVDTAGIDPNPVIFMALRELTASANLLTHEIAGT